MSNTSHRSQISSGMSRQSSNHHRSVASNSQSGHQHTSTAHRSHLSSTRPPQATHSNSSSRHIIANSRGTPVQPISSHRNQQNLRFSSNGLNSHGAVSWSSSTAHTTRGALVQSNSTARTTNSIPRRPSSSTSTTNSMHPRSTSTGRTTNRALIRSTSNNWSRSSSTNRGTSTALGWSNSTARTGRHQEFQQRSSISSGPRNGEKEHWSHPGCILRWVDHHKPMYNCNGCRMDGMGMRYRCNRHDIDLHQECMSAHLLMRIVFQGDNCTFFNKPHRNHTYCDACGFKVEGFVFHSDRGRDFHPKCAKLETKIDIENIKYMLCPTLLSNCQWCKKTRAPGADKEIPGWAYVSSNGSGFHVNCVFRMAMEELRTGKDSTLTFQPNIGGGSRIGINRKLLEKLGIIGFKILLSTLLGPLGGVVHVVDLLPTY